MRTLLLLSVLLVLGVTGCSSDKPKPTAEQVAATATATGATTAAAVTASAIPDTPPGDANHGRELAEKFECARCHDGTSVASTPTNKHCIHCHQDVLSGKLGAKNEEAAKWREHIAHLRVVPSLLDAGKRLRRGWVESFLLNPHDLRPSLTMTMPRLAMTSAEARDIATWLVPDDAPEKDDALAGADPKRGRALMEANGCATCHGFTGVPELPGARAANAKEKSDVLALAPDLRFARDRLRPAKLIAWILDPTSLKRDALMPKLAITPEQARDIAAYVLTTPLAPENKPIPARLPVLDRKVSYQEVQERVLGITCVHCHSEPKTAIGDGGPGNGGGFGFKPKRFDVGTHRGINAGYVDAQGERQSVFAPDPDGVPHLVAALMARYSEEAGKPNPNVRGMPLGLPPLPLEDIQLVETWIAQGRPQ